MLLPDSRLNKAEHDVQLLFMKSLRFNDLIVGALLAPMMLAVYLQIRDLPDRKPQPPATTMVHYAAVSLPGVTGPLRLAGAWRVAANDRRFGGLSGMVIDRGQFVAVSDLGAAVRFDPPAACAPMARIVDLADGPGDPAYKTSRDAESLVRDPHRKRWLVSFEQRHSVWRYDDGFAHGTIVADLDRPDWKHNRGIEGMVADGQSLLLAAENGREAMQVGASGVRRVNWSVGMEVADAATAPDGTPWLLLRGKGLGGIAQAIAPLVRTATGYRVGARWLLPKAPLDNYEGMAIAARPGGGWRFWLVTDDGHRIMARTLLVALDLDTPPDKQTPDVERRAPKSPHEQPF